MRPETNDDHISDYFEYTSLGIEVEQDGLQALSFGEYLVSQRAITRSQLFSALQLQDQNPGVRLSECIAKIGVMDYPTVESHLTQWNRVRVVDVEAAP